MTTTTLCRNQRHPMTGDNVHIRPNGTRQCIACRRTADMRRHKKDKAKRNAAKNKLYHERYKDDRRERNLAKFGLTAESYDAMLAAQGGRCAICRTDTPGGKHNTRFMVDHDHRTGCVRGLLCSRCNIMLGNALDAPATLRAGAAYLETGDGR